MPITQRMHGFSNPFICKNKNKNIGRGERSPQPSRIPLLLADVSLLMTSLLIGLARVLLILLSLALLFLKVVKDGVAVSGGVFAGIDLKFCQELGQELEDIDKFADGLEGCAAALGGCVDFAGSGDGSHGYFIEWLSLCVRVISCWLFVLGDGARWRFISMVVVIVVAGEEKVKVEKKRKKKGRNGERWGE
ncbi:hypothetical protein BZA05DRAFT_104952 [Tricharina praecox]|uniref:uncharacterized protein n=1 Tax=Tricharina praecox TaxID=43433 RepID=UPI00221EA211|nr:uncharacterized protein BZA05DRAFT_104952 [Tricharina praecox]KAI5857740.1 hypothetical protein BZA05DRAFT_104952 [Tricharina praecox]